MVSLSTSWKYYWCNYCILYSSNGLSGFNFFIFLNIFSYFFESVFVFNSIIIFVGGIIMFIFVKPKPHIGSSLTCETSDERNTASNGINSSEFDDDNQEVSRFIFEV
jgi:hypothetical protein